MLKRLKLRSFKSWPEADLTLAPITVLFGANSSGKSSLLQFLLLLKQTKDATDRALAFEFGNDRTPVSLGSYRNVVFRHEETREIAWDLSWSLPETVTIRAPGESRDFVADEMELSSAVVLDREQPRCQKICYSFGGNAFFLRDKRGGYELGANADGFQFQRIRGRPPAMPGPMKSYAFPDHAKTNFQNADFLAELEVAYEAQMDRIYHLGPLREYPKRQYGWAGSRPTDVGRRGEQVIEAMLAARAAGDRQSLEPRRKSRPFEEIIAHWLKRIGLIERFRIEEIGEGSNLFRAWVRISVDAPEVLITEVGFGVSQVLPAVVLLHYVPKGSTVILEQPEIHLHPSVQANLADVIVHVAANRGIQVVVESHSEHLLRRLQRRIAEERVGESMAKLYFCKMTENGSTLEQLRVTPYGEIENWPDKFFGDEFGEIAAVQEAGLRRRMGQRAAE